MTNVLEAFLQHVFSGLNYRLTGSSEGFHIVVSTVTPIWEFSLMYSFLKTTKACRVLLSDIAERRCAQVRGQGEEKEELEMDGCKCTQGQRQKRMKEIRAMVSGRTRWSWVNSLCLLIGQGCDITSLSPGPRQQSSSYKKQLNESAGQRQ